MPCGGSFSRSSVNRRSGARTRLAGGVTGLAVLGFLPFAWVLEPLPLAVLGAIVIAADGWRISRTPDDVGRIAALYSEPCTRTSTTAYLWSTCRSPTSTFPIHSICAARPRYPNAIDIEPIAAVEAALDRHGLIARDTKSRTGEAVRVIGYSPTADRVLVVVLLPEEHPPRGLWHVATAWPAGRALRDVYADENEEEP